MPNSIATYPISLTSNLDKLRKGIPMELIETIFAGLMKNYLDKVEYARRVLTKLESLGESFQNDHVAFRTFGLPRIGIDSLEKVFLAIGYTKQDYMYFEAKKLNAYWYRPPDLTLPKVFISELIVDKLSDDAQSLIRSYTDVLTEDPAGAVDFTEVDQVLSYLHTYPWRQPSYADYQQLLAESEYAAWVLTYGNELNHFTISVNALETIPNLQALNDLLEAEGIPLNDSGGKIKGTPESGLMQSSTVANSADIAFSEGSHRIPYSYMEFAERFVEPQHADVPLEKRKPEHYFQGFIPKSADKIFESTYTAQVKKENAC